jgi:hypothetical protein
MLAKVSVNFKEVSLKRLCNRPLNEHALRVMGGACDGKMSPSVLLRAMSPSTWLRTLRPSKGRVEWLVDLSIESLIS